MSLDASSPSAEPPSLAPAIPQLTRTRTVLRVLLALAVLLPIAFLLWYGWSTYQSARTLAEADVERMVHIAEEHALKVFEINEQINNRVLELLRGKSNREIRRDEKKYHRLLGDIGSGIPQLQSINVFDAEGKFLVTSRIYPAPNTSVADRKDFYYHRQSDDSGSFVSPLFIGRASKQPVFNLSVARRDANKEFLGVVNVSLRPEYFADYYRDVTESATGAAIALVHRDGSLIVRYPHTPEAVKFLASDPLMKHYAAGAERGHLRFRSAVDNKERYFSFRQVGDYPLYLVASYRTEVWRQAWGRQFVNALAFTLLPSMALWALLVVTLRRLQREEEGWNQWRAEVTQRQAMELAYKQARRLEALGQLTGGVAHDFNNLLMVVATSTMLLRRRLQDRTDIEQPLGALERSVESGKRLTRQLLAFSRKQPLRPEVLDVERHIREFIELVQTTLGGRIQLDMDIKPGLKPIYADEAEFELALLNLALNARDAMAEGGHLRVCVYAETAAANSELNVDAVAVAFEDTGHGIEAKHLKRIFEPFYTTKDPGRGTGLGLAQVRAFCEEAGGSVRVTTVVDQGTTVTMLLPTTDRQLVPAVPREIEILKQSSGRVMLVEDNPEVAAATRVLLEQLGYTPEIHSSAEDAIARLKRDGDWTLVVSDVLMPNGMSGITLGELLRVTHPGLPVLLVTGYTAQLEQAKAANLRVLAKPFDAMALRSAIDETLADRAKT